ncbi:MAG TPA: hypothetical protein VHO94_02645 [Oscillospiraceae bacterium]|nr:hypothetical protein [Oscillospiraceae bacterium]
MNILVVTGSPRKGGNTEIMADVFAESGSGLFKAFHRPHTVCAISHD